jgi:hypothetical protein
VHRIAVGKAEGIGGSLSHLVVNGKTISGNLIPLPASSGKVVEVEAFVE